MKRVTKAELETIIRYDQEERVLHLFTAHAPVARRWQRLGYPVKQDGKGWAATGPVDGLRLRRLVDGQLKRRQGRPLGPQKVLLQQRPYFQRKDLWREPRRSCFVIGDAAIAAHSVSTCQRQSRP